MNKTRNSTEGHHIDLSGWKGGTLLKCQYGAHLFVIQSNSYHEKLKRTMR